MNDIMIAELTDVFGCLSGEEDLRLIFLRGKGKSFCAGADLNYMKNIASYSAEENFNDSMKLAQLFSSVYDCKVPVIAVVHGSCFGGANGLIAACDIAITSIHTVFAFSEVKLGLVPATIAPFVIGRIGEYGAKELMMTGKRFNGEEALKWKLVNHAIADNDMETEVEKWKTLILSNGPTAVRTTKELIRRLVNVRHDAKETMDDTAKLIARLRSSDEGQEGMSSFLEKRKPNWTVD
jgi:methylglutaconyl-CoA hydratase